MEETEKASKQVIDAKLKEWREAAIPGLYRSVKVYNLVLDLT
jgi:hypothetical protein